MPELVIILIVALIFFGPGKLPELGSGLGRAIRSFKKASEEGDEEKVRQHEDRAGKAGITGDKQVNRPKGEMA